MLPLLAGLLGCAQPAPAATEPPPIVLVSLDTLRADRLGAWGNADGLTPNLDRLAEESVVFEQAYAQANETCFSHASLFTSRYPSELGRLDSSFRLPPDVPTIASMLHAYGYATGAAVGGGYLAPVFGFASGFDHYDPTVDWGSLHETVPAGLRWADGAGGRPFYLLVHGYDAHARYLKPTPYGYLHSDPGYAGLARDVVRESDGTLLIAAGKLIRGAMPLEYLARTRARFSAEDVPAAIAELGSPADPLTDADVAHVRAAYDGAVTYADAWVGRLMAGLEQRGLLDRAWIVVFSDHGEELGEHGAFNHRFSLTEPVLHVPLLVRPPGGSAPRRVSTPVALLDILPTLAEIVGATPPAGIHGRSLLGSIRGGDLPARDLTFSEGAFRLLSAQGPGGLMEFSGISPDNPMVADLVAEARIDGPAFRVEGGLDRAATRDAMVAWRRSLTPSTDAGLDLPQTTRDSLRAKGYWEAGP